MLTAPSDASLVLTAPEIAEVVTRLEGEACTARRVRYLLSGLRLTDTESQRGRTRLYGPDDVAMMRLAVRLEGLGISSWVVRVVLSYGGEKIRAGWRADADVALAVRNVTGTIEPARLQTPTSPAVARVLLRSVATGNAAAIRRVRQTQPLVWRWRPMPASDAVANAQF